MAKEPLYPHIPSSPKPVTITEPFYKTQSGGIINLYFHTEQDARNYAKHKGMYNWQINHYSATVTEREYYILFYKTGWGQSVGGRFQKWRR